MRREELEDLVDGLLKAHDRMVLAEIVYIMSGDDNAGALFVKATELLYAARKRLIERVMNDPQKN